MPTRKSGPSLELSIDQLTEIEHVIDARLRVQLEPVMEELEKFEKILSGLDDKARKALLSSESNHKSLINLQSSLTTTRVELADVAKIAKKNADDLLPVYNSFRDFKANSRFAKFLAAILSGFVAFAVTLLGLVSYIRDLSDGK